MIQHLPDCVVSRMGNGDERGTKYMASSHHSPGYSIKLHWDAVITWWIFLKILTIRRDMGIFCENKFSLCNVRAIAALYEISCYIGLGYNGTRLYLVLTQWGRVTHICVGKLTIIASDNGLSPGWRQAIIWTNAAILLNWTLGTNFSEILSETDIFSFKQMHLKMSSRKWRPYCLDLNVLLSHGDMMTMKRLLHYKSFVKGIHQSGWISFTGVNDQWVLFKRDKWCPNLMFSLMSAWTSFYTTVQLPVIWDAMTLLWHHSNDMVNFVLTIDQLLAQYGEVWGDCVVSMHDMCFKYSWNLLWYGQFSTSAIYRHPIQVSSEVFLSVQNMIYVLPLQMTCCMQYLVIITPAVWQDMASLGIKLLYSK